MMIYLIGSVVAVFLCNDLIAISCKFGGIVFNPQINLFVKDDKDDIIPTCTVIFFVAFLSWLAVISFLIIPYFLIKYYNDEN